MQRQLVQLAISGDHDAFAALVRAAASRQFAIASLILRDRVLAEDAVQDALVYAWRGLSALRDPDAWDAWLHRLTVRACYGAARRNRRRTLVEVRDIAPNEPQDAADESALLAERDLLGRQLGRLPIDQRAVLVLHFYVGLPLTEAAAVLGVPEGTAKSRLHRALTTLRTSMRVESQVPDALPRGRVA